MTRARSWVTSYRTRLALGYVLVVVLLAGAWAISLFGPLDAAVRDQQRKALTAVVTGDARILASSGTSLPATVDTLTEGTGWRMTVVASDGTVLADSAQGPSTTDNHSSQPEVQAALAGLVGTAERQSGTAGTKELHVAVPASWRGHNVAVSISEPVRTIADLAWQARTTSLLALMAVLGVAIFVAWRLSASATMPAIRLADSARRMAGGDLSSTIPPAEGELGELSEALSQLRDQMRERVARLETERRDLRTVLDGLAEAVFLVEDGVVTIANAAASELFSAPFGGWTGRALDDRVLPASLAATAAEQLAETSAAGARGPSVREIGPDPTGRWMLTTVLALPPAPPSATAVGARRALVIFQDVTERMRLDKMRTDFVANASHELKTPTAAIGLLAESASIAASDGDTDQALAFLGQIGAESDRLRRLVADLLDLSRLEISPEPGTLVDVRSAVDLSVSAHGAAARAKGLGLTANLAEVSGQDVYATADPTDVAVALDNLLDNAIAYTETGAVEVGVRLEDSMVAIDVRDSGMGIPAQDLDRVFERFYRVDRSRTRGTGGTGLGLSLVRNIASRAGGAVAIESEVGTGTRVTLRLPRA